MDELIIQVLLGEAPPPVAERVRQWRAESPENEEYFRLTSRVWSLTEPTENTASAGPVDPAVIIRAAEARRSADAPSDILPISHAGSRFWKPNRVIGWSVALAAGIAAVALGIREGVLPSGATPAAVWSAPATASRTVTLEDGSFVKLAAGSRLEMWKSDEERRVSLTGRAFFAVAHDPARPFTVRSEGVEARVLGTRFEVSDMNGSVRTVVVDGLVAVSNDEGSVEVPAGSLAQVRPDAAPITETPEDIYAALDWPEGVLLFNGTPLGQVAREVGGVFGKNVVVEDERLRALRISGTFEHQSFEEVVLALCETVGAKCTLTESGATIAEPMGH